MCVICLSRHSRWHHVSFSSMRLMQSVKAVTISMGGNDEREQTLNQLLAEMDGFESNQRTGIFWQQPTVRRFWIRHYFSPGRFDRRIIVEKPDLKGRVEDLKGSFQRCEDG